MSIVIFEEKKDIMLHVENPNAYDNSVLVRMYVILPMHPLLDLTIMVTDYPNV